MRYRRILLILSVIALLILAACKTECKVDGDCDKRPANAFTAKCVDKKCVYTPVPGVCGNGLCDGNENGCNCATDCGECKGAVQNSKYLLKSCVQDQCVETVPEEKVKPVYLSSEQGSSGDKFKLDTIYNQPFNMRKDTFDVTLTLSSQGTQNSDEHILSMELNAQTMEGRTITLTRQDVNRYLWSQGSSVKQPLILDFLTTDLEGELKNLVLTVNYEYAITSGGKKTQKKAQFKNTYREKFAFARPSKVYACPPCDDKIPGTRDICDKATGFCKHEPIPGACGNGMCDGNENKCTCTGDCGECKGSAGNFLDFMCQGNQCVTILKTTATITPKDVFDDRSLGLLQLQNHYIFNNPFDVINDEMELRFTLYRVDPSVSGVTVETIRLLEGTQQIAEQQVNQEVTAEGTTVKIKIPSIAKPEEEHTINLGVWYKYAHEGEEKRSHYNYNIGKITLIKPG